MTKTLFTAVASLSLTLVSPAFGKTYKYPYSVSCAQLWGAVKGTLSNADNYADVKPDDANLTASYNPKHSAHFDVSGVILQRTNKVTLVAMPEGCEMQVVSNYSGWGHEDQGDFKKRVDAALANPKPAAPPEPTPPAAAPVPPASPAEPPKPTIPGN